MYVGNIQSFKMKHILVLLLFITFFNNKFQIASLDLFDILEKEFKAPCILSKEPTLNFRPAELSLKKGGMPKKGSVPTREWGI